MIVNQNISYIFIYLILGDFYYEPRLSTEWKFLYALPGTICVVLGLSMLASMLNLVLRIIQSGELKRLFKRKSSKVSKYNMANRHTASSFTLQSECSKPRKEITTCKYYENTDFEE